MDHGLHPEGKTRVPERRHFTESRGQGFGQASSNSGGAFSTFGGGQAGSGRETKLEPTQADFSIFEQRLGEVQSAFGSEDLKQLRDLATPEMVSYFAEELAANNRKGVVNRISDVKLLQGDLAEAWREQNAEYATVAMRFSLIELDGGPDHRQHRFPQSLNAAAGDRGMDV